MKICILASGSKGNCVYLEKDNFKVLLDIGISYKQLRLKLSQIGVKSEEINAVFITHEHADHVMGLRTFSNNIKCDFYLTQGTYDNLKYNVHETLNQQNFKIIKGFDELLLGGIHFLMIPTHHDSKEPIGFKITSNNKSLVYITDTGYIDMSLDDVLKNCHFYILESNYDPGMLYSTTRPQHLKKRIHGDRGHMSNEDSAINLCRFLGENTRNVIHAHISLECNTEEVLVETFRRILFERNANIDNVSFCCAKQYEISEVFEL